MRILAGIVIAVLIGAILWRPDAPRVPWCVAGTLVLMWVLVMSGCAPSAPTETFAASQWVRR